MKKKLLPAIILSLAVAASANAESALETALKDEAVEQFIMPSNQSVTTNLPPQTNDFGRIFVINDDETATLDNYYNISGNNHSGFNFQEGALALYNVNTVNGFSTTGNGGAFNMTDDADLEWYNFVDKDHLGTITGNTATGNGGGIYSDGHYAGAVQLHGVSVTNNQAGGKGGGIYASYGTHSLFANSGAVLNFTGNTSSLGGDDIYLTNQAWMRIVSRGNGTATATVNVDNLRLDNKSQLYIVTPQADAGAGTVNIKNIQLSNGSTLDFSKDYKHSNTTIDNLSLNNGSILNTVNKSIEDSLNIKNISLDSSKNMFMIDADLRAATLGIDQFKNVSGGNLNIAVNVIGADGNTQGALTLFKGTVNSNLTIADSSTIYGNNKYTFKQNPNNKGQLLVSKERSGDAVTLQYALATYDENEYELPTFTVLTADLGELVLVDDYNNPITREFVLKGENGFLTSDGHNGVIINGQQDRFGTKFTAENISAVAGFVNEQANETEAHAKGSFISAQEADLNISNSLIYANNAHAQGTNAVAKGGAISVEGLVDDTQIHTTTISNVEFDSNIATSDKSNAYGGAIHSKFNNLNIENSTFTNNIADGKSTTQGGAINFENLKPSMALLKLNIKDTTFENNSAVSQGSSPAMGGALAITGNEGPSVEVNLENVIFRGNNVTTKSSNIDRYALGGAIYNENGRISLKNVQFIDNKATSSTSGTTVYSDITNRGVNGSVTFLGGDTTLKGGIVNRFRMNASGGHVIVTDGANLTFAETSKLQQGSLIINDGTVTVSSADTNNSLDRLSVASGSSLTLNSALVVGTDNEAGETVNNGTITNNSDSFVIGKSGSESVGDRIFTNNGAINGEGKIELTYSTLDNNGTITNDVTLTKAEAILNSKYENLTGNVTLSNAGATYNILNDNVTFDDADRIQGTTGKLYVGGNILSDAQLNYTGDVYLKNGAAVTLGNGDAFQNVGNLYIGTGDDDIVLATLNILNGKNDALTYGNKLHLGQYSELGVDMDWGDTLSADSTYINNSAKLNINKIDISNASAGDNYTFAAGAKDVVSLANVDLITATGMANTITYDNTTGILSAKRDTLANVVRTSDMNDDENAYYSYAMDSDEPGSFTSNVIGNLKVNGNGNSIVDKGLLIGDRVDVGSVILKDTNVKNVKAVAGGGAIIVNDGSSLTIQADNHDVSISGTNGANKTGIYMYTTMGGTPSTVALEANNGHTITIDDDIRSNDINNQLFMNNGKIVLNGELDPLKAVNTGADVTRGGKDSNIQWQLFGGTLTYLNDNYLSNPGALNSVEMNGGALDLRNGSATNIALNNFTLSNTSNLYVDADLANKSMDKFNATTTTYNAGTLNVAGINLLSDADAAKTTINFTSDAALMGNINYTGSTALSRIFKYTVGYDNTTGDFNFTRFSSGGYQDYNPAVLATPVAAQLGGYLSQLNSYDQAFRNMDMYMLMPKEEREAMKNRNKYAANDGTLGYDDSLTAVEKVSGWFNPYATFEKVELKKGPKVNNTMYGSYFGLDSGIRELGNGWDGIWGVYAGYNGSHQHYNGVGIYQNGGTLGLNGMLYKNNFFTGLTVNVGANAGQADTMFGDDDFAMLMTGVASKTGYNWELADGKFIIQPSYMMSYTMVNTFDYTNAAGVRINSDPLHAIQFEPGLKFIGNLKNGWQPYAGVSVVWNAMDKTDFKANDASLPNMSVKPFVKYGVGVRKTWGERFTGFLQAFVTNGGRNGVGLQAGFRWALGKDPNKK